MDMSHKVMAVQWSIFALCIRLMSFATAVQANPFNGIVPASSLCQVEHSPAFQSKERRIDTSLSLELKPNSFTGPCKQLFEAPPSHGLYVRVHPISLVEKNKHEYSTSAGSPKNMNIGGHQMMRNESCPIHIHQPSIKSSTPWRFDPCQLQLNGGEEARLLTSPLRIVWQHNQNWPNYRLTITAYGEGAVCDEEGRHACLRLGEQKLVCISEELLCDGTQHCPSGKEFVSDESPAVCESVEKKKNQWLKVLRDLVRRTYQSSFPGLRQQDINGSAVAGTTELHQATSFTLTRNDYNKTYYVETVIDSRAGSNIRKNFPKGLSKYGPWGYLMLGMLLCGGALLVCGLWECCCRKTKPVTPLNAGSLETTTSPGMDVTVISNTFAAMHQHNQSDSLQAVINYDEIEPPPSYAILFPNQKSTEDLTQIATSSRSNNPRPASVAE